METSKCQACRENHVYVNAPVKGGRCSGALCKDCYTVYAERRESHDYLYTVDYEAFGPWRRWGLTIDTALFFDLQPWELREAIEAHNLVSRFLDRLESEGGQAGYFGHGYLQYFDALRDAQKEAK